MKKKYEILEFSLKPNLKFCISLRFFWIYKLDAQFCHGHLAFLMHFRIRQTLFIHIILQKCEIQSPMTWLKIASKYVARYLVFWSFFKKGINTVWYNFIILKWVMRLIYYWDEYLWNVYLQWTRNKTYIFRTILCILIRMDWHILKGMRCIFYWDEYLSNKSF